jgi:hypothetical protein
MQRPSTGPSEGLTTVLSHFPELEAELEPLGSGYNVNQTSDEIEVP